MNENNFKCKKRYEQIMMGRGINIIKLFDENKKLIKRM